MQPTFELTTKAGIIEAINWIHEQTNPDTISNLLVADVYLAILQKVEVDKLQDVMNRGNSTSLPIIFNPDQNRDGELGFNKTSYSYYFGNHSNSNLAYYNNAIGYNCLNSVTSGKSNSGFGSYTMELLTTGEYNSSYGGYSLVKLISGRRNSAFGNATGNNLTTGSHNTMLGIGALPIATTSNSNIAIGDSSLPNVVTKGNNIGLGKDTGAGGEASHCVYIGSRAGAGNTTDGILAIHNWRLNQPNTGTGSYIETVAQMNVANSLIYGSFIQKWLIINGDLTGNTIKAKPTGTFPSTPSAGQIAFKTPENKHFGYNGTKWNALY